MPLVNCPDCGRDVSTSASVCIHCGRPLRPSRLAVALLAGLVAAFLGLFAVYSYTLMSARRDKEERLRAQCEAERAERRLKAQVEAEREASRKAMEQAETLRKFQEEAEREKEKQGKDH